MTTGAVVSWRDGSDFNLDALFEGQIRVIEDCVYLRDVQGDLYLTVWPIGTTWDSATAEVVLADGRRLKSGLSVRVGGGGGDFLENESEQAYGAEVDNFADLVRCAQGSSSRVWLMDAAGTVAESG